MSPLFVLVLLTSSTWTAAVPQYLTFYSEKNQTGEYISFHTNAPDLEPYVHSIVTKKGSYQVVGWWNCMSEKNYTGDNVGIFDGNISLAQGNNDSDDWDWSPFLSCRHHGAVDTDTAAISLYSQVDFVGIEQFSTEHAFPVHIPVRSYSITGKSNWTLIDFYENPSCVVPMGEVHEEKNITTPIKFIAKGCD